MLTGGYQPELPGTLVAGNVAHLSVAASEAIGVVGPLVIPGRTSCLSCVDMARTDRDPAWPLILAQACGRAPHPVACAAMLAAAVAAQATAAGAGLPRPGGPGRGRDQRHTGARAARLAVAPAQLGTASAVPL